jgi:tetratricopeptide (TPR) repeat protein
MNALLAFCYMRAKNDATASSMYALAYKAGIRNIRILLNYADVNRRSGQYLQATKLYTEVVERDPENAAARRGRANCHLWTAVRHNNSKKLVAVQPDEQAFEDSRADVRLSDDAVAALFLAAQVFGYAVKIDPTLAERRAEGAGYLKRALKNGLTRYSFDTTHSFLQPLSDSEIEALAERAPARDAASSFEPLPQQDLPHSPRWSVFLEEVGEVREHVARVGP